MIVRKNFRLGRASFCWGRRRGWNNEKHLLHILEFQLSTFGKKRRRASKFLNPLRKEKIFALIFLGERLKTTFLYKQLHFEFDSLAESLKNLKKWTFKRIIWVILYFFEKIYFLIFSYKTSKYIERERELKSRSSYVTTSDGCYFVSEFLVRCTLTSRYVTDWFRFVNKLQNLFGSSRSPVFTLYIYTTVFKST